MYDPGDPVVCDGRGCLKGAYVQVTPGPCCVMGEGAYVQVFDHDESLQFGQIFGIGRILQWALVVDIAQVVRLRHVVPQVERVVPKLKLYIF
jgi:hypothetical protein